MYNIYVQNSFSFLLAVLYQHYPVCNLKILSYFLNSYIIYLSAHSFNSQPPLNFFILSGDNIAIKDKTEKIAE